MRERIRCLFHSEETPSLVRQKAGWRCYGACAKLYTDQEVEERLGQPLAPREQGDYESYQEDLVEKFRYIESLPRREIRGLELPSDERGYYVCWPGRDYYKYRLSDPEKGRYLSPTGHKPPLFWGKRQGSQALILTEGEINCLSLAKAFPEADHCSPGSASQFNLNYLEKDLLLFKQYSSITVILDDDPAGTKGLIEAKAFFRQKIPFVRFIQITPDANEILVHDGIRALRARVQGADHK